MPGWLLALIVLAAIYAVAVLALILAGRGVAARELALLLPNLILLFKDLLRDPRVPRGPKIVLAVGIVWLVSPIDLLPEFLPVIGPLDDAVVAALVLRHLVHRAGAEVVREHWRGEPDTLELILRGAG
ncbi:MAG: YkvA family protein, partial [Actinomycetota bacterium]